jgi:hypothetical protein
MSNQPKDLDRGVEMYLKFHQLEPKNVGQLSISKIPSSVKCVGKMVNTKYASKKWEGVTNFYTHDHDSGVKIYFPGSGAHTPSFITNATTLVKLGRCISLEYVNHRGDECYAEGNAGTELYCIPSGKALVVVQDKRKIEAIIYGGKLTVEARGICG